MHKQTLLSELIEHVLESTVILQISLVLYQKQTYFVAKEFEVFIANIDI